MRLLLMKVKNFFQLYTDSISFVCGVVVGALIPITFISAKSAKESSPFLWDAVGAVGTILAAVIAVLTYRNSVERQKKQDTIREFSKIREKYPNLSPKAHNPVSDDVRIEYLKEMERFCTGVLIKLYDIHVVDKMVGSMLITQYDSYMKDFIDKRKNKTIQKANPNDIYKQYKGVIENLKSRKQTCPNCKKTTEKS